jgi:hypothetical protein
MGLRSFLRGDDILSSNGKRKDRTLTRASVSLNTPTRLPEVAGPAKSGKTLRGQGAVAHTVGGGSFASHTVGSLRGNRYTPQGGARPPS